MMVIVLTMSWMPLAISWIEMMIDDSVETRAQFKFAMSIVGIGIWSLHWVGYYSFIGVVFATDKESEGANIFFGIFYLLLCAGMVVMHWILEHPINHWLIYAPFASEDHSDGIDADC
jgi:hypothetical protein